MTDLEEIIIEIFLYQHRPCQDIQEAPSRFVLIGELGLNEAYVETN